MFLDAWQPQYRSLTIIPPLALNRLNANFIVVSAVFDMLLMRNTDGPVILMSFLFYSVIRETTSFG